MSMMYHAVKKAAEEGLIVTLKMRTGEQYSRVLPGEFIFASEGYIKIRRSQRYTSYNDSIAAYPLILINPEYIEAMGVASEKAFDKNNPNLVNNEVDGPEAPQPQGKSGFYNASGYSGNSGNSGQAFSGFVGHSGYVGESGISGVSGGKKK